mmetsp:Transcript_22470/g.55703  ORF Transcript_22470/g.55703 Transcript_22470/m.55703 type:complete len:252 (+) Transcript_22470:764-1519(+)
MVFLRIVWILRMFWLIIRVMLIIVGFLRMIRFLVIDKRIITLIVVIVLWVIRFWFWVVGLRLWIRYRIWCRVFCGWLICRTWCRIRCRICRGFFRWLFRWYRIWCGFSRRFFRRFLIGRFLIRVGWSGWVVNRSTRRGQVMRSRNFGRQDNSIDHMNNAIAGLDVGINDFRQFVRHVSSTLLKYLVTATNRTSFFLVSHHYSLCTFQLSTKDFLPFYGVVQQDEFYVFGTTESVLRNLVVERFKSFICGGE